MVPVACRGPYHDGLTGTGISSMISYLPISQKLHWHDANFCLGENPAENFNHSDLCYSFNLLCEAEYGGRKGLHISTKNYMRNYAATTGPYGDRRIPYERALQNLVVIMFSHSVDNFENTGSQEGHRTLVIHECLTVAHKLGKFHRWQHRVPPEDRDKEDWKAEVKPGPKDFRYKYSIALELLGTAHSPTFAHPWLLGRCYDNVYHQGRFIGKLPARGKPPTEDNTRDVYNQEYGEVVGRIKDSLDLDRLSNWEFLVPFCPILCSLKNPDIILHPEDFAKRQNLPPPALGHIQPARDYEVDGAVGMVDVSWSQRIPGIVEDDIDKDPHYNQYPYQEGDDLDYEEDMDVEEAPAADTGTSTSRVSRRPGAEYEVDGGESTPGITPRSTHTDTDAAADLDTLQVGTPHPEYHHVVPSDEPRNVFGTVSQTDPVAAFTMSVGQVTAKLVSAQIFGRFQDTTTMGRERPAQSADVTDDAERALRERILQRRLAQAQLPEGAKRESVFQRLGGRAGEGQLQVWPEMTPRKVERGRQPGRGSDMSDRPASCSQSGQKRRSTS